MGGGDVEVIEEMLSQYARFCLSKEQTFFKEVMFKSPLMRFFEASMHALAEFGCENSLKQRMMHGLMKALSDLPSSENANYAYSSHFNEWLIKQVSHLEKETSCFTTCQASIAAYLLLQLQVFDGGRPKNGRTVLPCFGLEDVEMWRYSQAVLRLFERATYEWVTARLHVNVGWAEHSVPMP